MASMLTLQCQSVSNMSNYYTIVFTPSTWESFLALPKKALGFRLTLATSINKIKDGDVLLCYLAERMTWCAVLTVMGTHYESKEHIFSTKHGLPLVLDVDPTCLLAPEQEIPVKTKELWDRLDRFKEEDHHINGWAVKVGLIRSLRRLSFSDGNTLREAIFQAKNHPVQTTML